MSVEPPLPSTAASRSAQNANDPVACAIWMVVACATLAGVATIGRYLTTSGIPAVELVFLRSLVVVLTLSPILAWRGRSLLETDRIGIYFLRVLVTTLAMVTWFAALAYIPVGEVTAISFLAPLFTTLGAALILKEVVRARRWTATIVGFIGALVILRPGISEFQIGNWLAIVSAIAMGGSSLFIKFLSRRDDANKIVFLTTILMVPVTLIPALLVWQWPNPLQWTLLVAIGISATLGHVALTKAISAADASFAMTLDFLRLPFAVSFGFLIFGEVIELWTWVGAAIIFGASFVVARRESRLREQTAN